MTSAAQPLLQIDSEQRRMPRNKVRLSARVQSCSRLSFDSLASDGDDITDVTVNDLSLDGLSTSARDLAIGSIVRLQVPLVGWRDAEVRWLREGQAGCRFLTPLTQEQLHLAIASSPVVTTAFPGLIDQIGKSRKSDSPVMRKRSRIRLPTLDAFSDESHRDRWVVIFCISFITIVMATLWTILIVLSL